MREFDFRPANDWNKWDAKGGKCPSVWELSDVKYAMEAHAKRYSTKRTLSIFREVTGVDAERVTIRQLPSRFYGVLISWYCKELADRPHAEAS